jgi:4-amino-4-deoxy-L-arabinose transferase-like glycosyltransferase
MTIRTSQAVRASRTGSLSVGVLALLCLFVFFWRLGGNGLFDLDEALYVACAREMRLSGDYVTPRINGERFFEKPPLVYWAAAAMFAALGVNEFAARLPAALSSALLTGLIFWFGGRQLGRRAGFLAAAFFALSPLVLGAARQLTMDALLDLWIALALLCFFMGRDTGRAGWYYGFWAACGLGVLTKGAPGLIFPVGIALLWIAFLERFQIRGLRRGILAARPLSGLLLFLIIVLPWHLAAWHANGDAFVQEYIVRQHLQRFRGGDEAHRAPFWFYLPGFLVGFFPWSVFIPAPLFGRLPQASPDPPESENRSDSGLSADNRARLLLKIWFAVIFLFFSASGSKLISYILPMYAAAALLAGDWCSRVIERQSARRGLLAGAGGGMAIALLCYLAVVFHQPVIRLVERVSGQSARIESVPPAFVELAAHLFGAGALATGLFFVLLLLRRALAAFGGLLAGMTLFVGVAVVEGLPVIDGFFMRPLHTLTRQAGQEALQGVPLAFYVGPPRRPSVYFYLPDALLQARSRETRRVQEYLNRSDVDRFLTHNRPALILTDEKRAARLLAQPSIHILARQDRWLLLRSE